MVSCLDSSNDKSHLQGDRESLRIYNILDTNIVPINFHALQRELPLINLHNYSYTFDQLSKQHYGVESKTQYNADITNKIDYDYANDELVKILLNPLGVRTRYEYINTIRSLMTGGGPRLNKPKYLSDQLWNKVLCNSIYSTTPNAPNNIVTGNFHRGNAHLDKGFGRTFTVGAEQALQASNLLSSDAITVPNKQTGPSKHEFPDIETININNQQDLVTWTQTGYGRYNTVLVRYIEWFVHLQRVMRMLMREQLEWVSDPIVHKSNAIGESITEYDSNRSFTIKDFE
jgi:hypothetical protein